MVLDNLPSCKSSVVSTTNTFRPELGAKLLDLYELIIAQAHSVADPNVRGVEIEFLVAQVVRKCNQICDDDNSSDPNLKQSFASAASAIEKAYPKFRKERVKYPPG